MKKISIFISYSWENEAHQEWVAELADRLDLEQDMAVIFDRYDLRPGMDLPKFMERASEVDKVLTILTPSYKERATLRVKGVGYESKVITARLLAEAPESLVIPVLRGTPESSIPAFLAGKVFLDLNDRSPSADPLEDLLRAIRDQPTRRRPSNAQKGVVGAGHIDSWSDDWSFEFLLPEQEAGPPNRVVVSRQPRSRAGVYHLLLLLRDKNPITLAVLDSHFIEVFAEDFDGDGRPELAVLYHCGAHSRGLKLYRLDSNLDVREVPGSDLGSDWPLIEWADLNCDGKLEIRARNRDWKHVPVMDYIDEIYGWSGEKLILLSTENEVNSREDA
jgi:hypothetical protein